MSRYVLTARCDRATAGNVTIVFTDAQGNTRQERHSSYTPGSCITYHVGEDMTVHYVPTEPGALMTQPELDELWWSLLVFGMGDILFLGGGIALFVAILPWASRRLRRMRAQAS